MYSSQDVQQKLRTFASSERAESNRWFFKTGPGEYGEGDQFIGISLPQIRKIAIEFETISITELEKILQSPIHEDRLTALIILTNKFKKAPRSEQQIIYNFYLAHTKFINNWDLVDCSAAQIVGSYLTNKKRNILIHLAKSASVWDRRIAMISCFHFIRMGESADAFYIAELLLKDRHDLIQKAVGWMLREIGKRCGEQTEEDFLLNHYLIMPRTSLRYAIERFPEDRKKFYMKKL